MLKSYLESIQAKVIYHAASLLTKTLVPRVSGIGTMPKDAKSKINYKTKNWERKAVYAATEKNQAIPFGLERVNMTWPGTYTEEEVNSWTKACWLSVNNQNILQVYYWKHIPKKPLYLYTVDPKDFTLITDNPGGAVEQWYSNKVVTPLKVDKLLPNQVKGSWVKATDANWERKKKKYKEKGFYKK